MSRYDRILAEVQKTPRPSAEQIAMMARYEAAIEEAEKRAEAAEGVLAEHLRRPMEDEARSLYAEGISTWWIARLLGLPRGVVRALVHPG